MLCGLCWGPEGRLHLLVLVLVTRSCDLSSCLPVSEEAQGFRQTTESASRFLCRLWCTWFPVITAAVVAQRFLDSVLWSTPPAVSADLQSSLFHLHPPSSSVIPGAAFFWSFSAVWGSVPWVPLALCPSKFSDHTLKKSLVSQWFQRCPECELSDGVWWISFMLGKYSTTELRPENILKEWIAENFQIWCEYES